MKVRLTFKTPDVIFYAIEDEIPEGLYDIDPDKAEAIKDEIKDACNLWVKNGEYLTVEIDTETGICTPIKAE